MTEADRKFLIPARLDDAPKFLWWDFDVAILFMGSVMLGILTYQTLTFSALGLALAFSYQKVKAGRSRAFGLHALYWFLPVSFGFKVTPQSALREFIG